METSTDLSPPQTHPASSQSRSSSPGGNVRRQETKDSDKAGRVWARNVEDDPWAPCILTCDGGGIRGYSTMKILERLMKEVYEWEVKLEEEEEEEDESATPGYSGNMTTEPEDHDAADTSTEHTSEQPPTSSAKKTTRRTFVEKDLLPCHYFDFMYGTSTGGLIATILGRLRMTIAEGLELYRTVGEDLFGNRRSRIPLMTKYHHEPLENAVRTVVKARCFHDHEDCTGDDLHPWDANKRPADGLRTQVPFEVSKPRVCQTACLSATHDENISEAYLLRSYPHYYSETAPNWITRYNEGAEPLEIWKMARATTAAPFYFEMLSTVVDGVEKSFKDGGIRENNPSGAALSEFHAMWEGTKVEVPACLLSIGTGRPDTSQDGFASAWPSPFSRLPFVSKYLEKRAVVNHLLIKYTEGEKQHEMMRAFAHGEHTWYKRLNVSEGLERMPLDDWQKGPWSGMKDVPGGMSLTRMEEATNTYLERDFDPKYDSYGPPGTMLNQVAEKLVRQRRARERLGGERWDVFVGKGLKMKGNGETGAG